MWAQDKYSINALTGRGELILSDNEAKLQPAVQLAFDAMAEAAKKDGIHLTIASGYRSFKRQKQIWDRKFKEFTAEGLTPVEAIDKIIKYSTIPGTSRHHWGTDIDVIDSIPDMPERVLVEKHFSNTGVFGPLKKWMDKHANAYGFYLVYPDIKGRKGFNYEPWHYSYKGISRKMLSEYMAIDLNNLLKSFEIEGKAHFTKTFIENYKKEHILDISPVLK